VRASVFEHHLSRRRVRSSSSQVMRTTQAVQIIQKVLYKHEAAFKHFAQMGHGGIAVTAFGLPPFTQKPSASARRAVAAGCDVRAKLAQIGVFCTVGISAGSVCIGCLPSASRIEYALLGRPVALAIQMANACTERRPLLIDDICFQGTSRWASNAGLYSLQS
jgi:class 3 adenylate cyclase